MEKFSILVYSVISVIIISTIFNIYYILFLDWNGLTFKGNHIINTLEPNHVGFLIATILEFMSNLLYFKYIQDILIFFILILSGISMHFLVNTKSQIPKYFAGIFYMINPFVYLRFMAGHWLILLAYSLLPFVVKSIMKLMDNPDKKQTIKTMLWISLVAAINMHTLFLVFFLFLILYIFKLVKSSNKRQITKSLAIMALFFLLLNSYWLIPLLTAESTAISQITSDDLAAFETKKGNFNEFMETLMLYGFWRQDAYILPKKIIPFPVYFSLFAIILFLTIHGYLNCKEKYKTPILITGILAQLLAVGVGHPWFKDIFTFLFTHIFILKGFREPQKFVALLVFAYAFLGAYGIDNILEQLKTRKMKIIAAALIIVIPFAYTPTMFFSFWGQIHTTDYPNDWYEVNSYLNNDTQDFNVLFLPWHLYMDFKWIPNTDKRIANPAESFFDKPTIKGDNVEVGTIYSSSNRPISKYIEPKLKNLTGNDLKLLNVKYIIVAKEIDYKNYLYLLNQSDLELVKETENLILLKNKHEVSKFYQLNDLEKLDLMPLKYEKLSPVKYKINTPTKKYIIFTENYNKNWQLGNQQPLQLNAVNLYEFKDDFILKYKRFNVYLASYAVSILVLLLLLARLKF